MRYTSPVVAASIVAILAYAVFVKKSPKQSDLPNDHRIEIGTVSEAPQPIDPPALAPRVQPKPTPSKKHLSMKAKPKSVHFRKKSLAKDTTSKEVAAITGMTPAANDYNLTPAGSDTAIKPKNVRNLSNPKDERWIKELSGQRAKLNMGVARTNLNCDEDYRLCDRSESNKDVLVGGMVVKSERLVNNPTHPIDGQLVRGHFVRKTPAVYVK